MRTTLQLDDDVAAEVARLTALGAQELWKVDEPGAFHTTMTDPEGNEFCVLESREY